MHKFAVITENILLLTTLNDLSIMLMFKPIALY